MAAAKALAELARQDVPTAVKKAYPNRSFEFGRDYIIPTPFDPRLIFTLPVEIAKAAISSGAAKHHIQDWEAYKQSLAERMGLSTGVRLQSQQLAKL